MPTRVTIKWKGSSNNEHQRCTESMIVRWINYYKLSYNPKIRMNKRHEIVFILCLKLIAYKRLSHNCCLEILNVAPRMNYIVVAQTVPQR